MSAPAAAVQCRTLWIVPSTLCIPRSSPLLRNDDAIQFGHFRSSFAEIACHRRDASDKTSSLDFSSSGRGQLPLLRAPPSVERLTRSVPASFQFVGLCFAPNMVF